MLTMVFTKNFINKKTFKSFPYPFFEAKKIEKPSNTFSFSKKTPFG